MAQSPRAQALRERGRANRRHPRGLRTALGSASVPMREKTSVEVRQPHKCLFRIRDHVAPEDHRVEVARQRFVVSLGLNSQAWLVVAVAKELLDFVSISGLCHWSE